MLKLIFNWIKRLFSRKESLFYKYKFVDDVPGILNDKTIYVVGERDYYWQIVFLCPCGCKSTLFLNLLEEYKPSWRYQIEKTGFITLTPSINRVVGCKSHFFLRSGKVQWTRDG
ncbi:DUF6527 family protein [Polluticaenibacter yanchengensis]|uniref:DUF6527 family protein n=1 Tax=Polluticaenibacter yanchengensis TaxID=3014562 RepID=UPI00387A9264